MFMCSQTHRRLNHRETKREVIYQRELPELQKQAKENRDKAFERKYGKLTKTGRTLFTQQDYLKKYFAVV